MRTTLRRKGTLQPQTSNASPVMAENGGEDARREHEPGRGPHLRPATVEPPLFRWGVLDGHQDRPAPLAAEPKPLGEAQHDEKDGRPDSYLIEGRQAPDQEGGYAHDQERCNQHSLAPDPVPEVTEDDAAQRPGGEADGEGGERQQGARQLGEVRKNSAGKTRAAAVP